MPRGPRLDAPGVLHHVMARGLDRQVIFRDDRDRRDFVRRLEGLAESQRSRKALTAVVGGAPFIETEGLSWRLQSI
jgi:hypothetical protein